MTMLKKVGEWWLPGTEELGLKWFEKNPRGERPEVIDAAMKYVTNHDVALDVGAHVGTWTCELAKHFETVHAFEPTITAWMALAQNISERKIELGKVIVWLVGVGMAQGSCRPTFATNASLSSHIDPIAKGGLPMVALDDLVWGRVGLIKIDVEGFEWFVLQGARRLIAEDHPVLVLEWKPHHLNRWGEYEKKIEHQLMQWGYVLQEQCEIDRIYA